MPEVGNEKVMKTKPPIELPSSFEIESSLQVRRHAEELLSDDKRVILRYLDFHHPRRLFMILRRIMNIPEAKVPELLEKVAERFGRRHPDLPASLLEHYRQVSSHVSPPREVSEQRRRLIGAYFTQEYSFAGVSLFNPSIVQHSDQSNVPAGAIRFLMSLRATGEGHISSIVFRRGLITASGEIKMDPPPTCAYAGQPIWPDVLKRTPHIRKLLEMDLDECLVQALAIELPDAFNMRQLEIITKRTYRVTGSPHSRRDTLAKALWPAKATYEVRFPPHSQPTETVIFPATEYELHGMEDLRLVRFVDDDNQVKYFGTYTAVSNRRTHPMLLETEDFRSFRMCPIAGRYARDKGMALFPRRVNGNYHMISRHDGENLFLLRSDNLHCWNHASKLQSPTEPWELALIGNCGSPIETFMGWLLLTHGVGPMREYCIGAILLDRDDPSRVIGRLKQPLIVPTEEERGGYVPNVVYSCGSMVHNGQLIVPYAVSDSRTTFATVDLVALIDRLVEARP